VWNKTSRTPSRMTTKDLINRHKQRNTTAALVGKPNSNHIDRGIELWDYDPQGGKSDSNRIDRGIELWDYDPQGGKPDSSRIDRGIDLWDYDPQGGKPDSNRIHRHRVVRL
jgi:hypothetical protein